MILGDEETIIVIYAFIDLFCLILCGTYNSEAFVFGGLIAQGERQFFVIKALTGVFIAL